MQSIPLSAKAWLSKFPASACVSGPSRSGVSTLARRLSEITGFPVISTEMSAAARKRIGYHIIDADGGEHIDGYVRITTK